MYKTIVIDPCAKPRMTRQDTWKQRPCVQKYWAFCDALRKFTLDVDWESLDLFFHIPMPKSWSAKKKMNMVGTPHQQTPDIDNLCKAFMDALLDEDSFVWQLKATKTWGYDGKITVKIKDV